MSTQMVSVTWAPEAYVTQQDDRGRIVYDSTERDRPVEFGETDSPFGDHYIIGLRYEEGHYLAVPLHVRCERHASMTTVTDLQTGMFGQGPTYEEALQDFERALVEYKDVLARQQALSPGLREHLDFLGEALKLHTE